MQSHERFEELCAIAAAGEISPVERQDLDHHLAGCARCKEFFDDMQEIHATVLPQRSGFEMKRNVHADLRLRQAILQRVGAEGAHFSEVALSPPVPIRAFTPPVTHRAGYRYLALAGMFVLAVVGIGIGIRKAGSGLPGTARDRGVGTPKSAAANRPGQSGIENPQQKPNPEAAELGAARAELKQAQAEEDKLKAILLEARSNIKRLERELEQSWSRASTLETSNTASANQISNLQTQLEWARANESKVEAELANLKSSASETAADLARVEGENNDLRDKLAAQAATIDRERELLAAGRDIRDLIAARNLHIIDVYDTSGEGHTQKSFGRVFYTEGKSLVFYAYDLPARRRHATEYAFYAWGKRDGSGEAKVRNLGIFYNDDQSQKRWVLRVTNPNVLAEIDLVFVTLQKRDASSNIPTGKRLLSAYLGSPANHP
jgi:hypothetical protein